MAYLKSANANRNFKIAISLLNNMANLPEVEVLADIKLEFMECCKYELPDPRLKIPYLFIFLTCSYLSSLQINSEFFGYGEPA